MPQVLIIDPAYKAMNADENEGVEVRKVLDFLDDCIEGYQLSVVLIHHAGKDLSKRSRETTVLEDWVDSDIAMMVTSKKGEPLKIKITPVFMRHAPLPEHALEAELVDFEFEPIGLVMTTKDTIKEYVRVAGRKVTPKEIFDLNLGANTAVYKALKALVKDGLIKKESRGEYSWANKIE
jgi:hypothetical protein